MHHGNVAFIGLEPRFHAHEKFEQQSQRGGGRSREFVHEDLIVEEIGIVFDFAEVPHHVSSSVSFLEQLSHGGQFAIGGNVAIGGGLHVGMGEGDYSIGDVDYLCVSEGFDVEGEGGVSSMGSVEVLFGEEGGSGGLDAGLFLFERFARGVGEVFGGFHDGAGPVAEGAEHGGGLLLLGMGL